MKILYTFSVLSILLIVCCDGNYPLDLGNGYKLTYGANGYTTILDSTNSCVVYSHVLKYNFNSVFILAEQKPIDTIRIILRKKFNSERKSLSRDIIMAGLTNSPIQHFWIINKNLPNRWNIVRKKHSNVFGPFTKSEYLEKRKELGVPKSLQLD